ncbi:MAG: rhodanese-like domain-containing protein [Sporichthyaceae bacterium]
MTATVPDHGAHAKIEAAEVRRILEAGRPGRLLDVRTPGEFAAGHIEGSVNIPLDQLGAVAHRLAGPDPLIVVCQSGRRAVLACKTLADAGAVGTVLVDGMIAWTASGGPSRTLSGKWSLERQVRFVAGLIVFASIAASVFWEPARYLAGMVGAGLVFAAVSNTCAMGLLLAKLPYNRGSSCGIDSAVASLRN